MSTPTPAEVIAKRITDEQDRHSEALSKKLAPEMQLEGAKQLTREKLLELVHRNWQSASFRLALAKQHGFQPTSGKWVDEKVRKRFLALHEDMVKAHGDPMVMQGGRGPAGAGAAPPGLLGPAGGNTYGPPAAPVNGIPLPPYIPQPPTKWGG